MQDIIENPDLIQELSLEELLQGRLRDKNGSFRGRPTALVPREFYVAAARELRRRMEDGLMALGMQAIETIEEIMAEGEGASETIQEGGTTTTIKGGTQRLKAATYIVDRLLGKTPDRIELSADVSTWQHNVESGGLLVDVEVEDIPPAALEPAPARRGRRTVRNVDE